MRSIEGSDKELLDEWLIEVQSSNDHLYKKWRLQIVDQGLGRAEAGY